MATVSEKSDMIRGDGKQDEPWYTSPPEAVASKLQVNIANGLTAAEAQERLRQYGPNVLAEAKKTPAWARFLAQYKEYMQIVLVIAAVVSILIGEVRTGVGLLALTLLNAWLGYHQEGKAAASVAALNKMMKTMAKVRRDGQVTEANADQIVPGDIVIVDAGDRVPADGRVVLAATLQIEEAALTGESTAVDKNIDTISKADIPLGDRHDMAFMNTNVTRGHGEILVTTTGMNSEVGHIATMLSKEKADKSPLTKQIDRVTIFIIAMALFAFIMIVAIGLSQGQNFTDLFAIGVALAVGSIPSGLPAVVTTILSIGTVNMAKKNAIMKVLPAVETLGSTSAINSDKTGTLTMNQMTVREFTTAFHHYKVTGEGYSFDGQIQRTTGDPEHDLDYVLFPCALCNDSDIQDDKVVGDPTEAALYVLAEKGGIDVNSFRVNYPRIAMVPFDSDYKFMATFHQMPDEDGKTVVRGYVKGAPDVILDRSSTVRLPDGKIVALTQEMCDRGLAENTRIASQGMRVLALAQCEYPAESFDAHADLMQLMHDLELTALVGEVDPPRAEAKDAITLANGAGIRVRMITGDHAVTAAAIGHELGITGRAITGAEFAELSDEQANQQIDEIGVIARVAPEHKVRLVKVLQGRGEIAAMTGDGVNDAPAIKAADIGIAMGITGTDVAKEAAKMILTDDNFATIVAAVEEGRVVYDNLQKFLRIQIANLFSFILCFLGSAIFGIAGTAIFLPTQVLWVHFGIVAPIGALLGMDLPSPGIMQRKPRPSKEPIISRSMMVRLALNGLYMAAAALILYQIGKLTYGSPQIGQTMALVGLSLMNIPLALNLRFPERSAFGSATLSNARLLWAFVWAFFGTILITDLGIFKAVFQTTSLTIDQWEYCLVPAVILLIGGEIFKVFLRRRHPVPA